MSKENHFEASIQRLQQIVQQMEGQQTSLSDTFALFEEGLQLFKTCEQELKKYEDKLDELVKQNGDSEHE